MARRPLTAAFARVIGEMLTAEGFHEADGMRWWLRSDLGDFAVIDVQTSKALPGLENCFVNMAAVPGPRYDFLRWLDPSWDYGEAPGTVHGVWRDRVERPGINPWLTLTDKASAAELGGWVVSQLRERFLPRLRNFFDRDVLLAELAKRTASREAAVYRASFLAEAGDAVAADAALGPAEDDDESMANYRRWLREYAAATSRSRTTGEPGGAHQ
jgi:hypothetical protein